jgi:hypothetical protein
LLDPGIVGKAFQQFNHRRSPREARLAADANTRAD